MGHSGKYSETYKITTTEDNSNDQESHEQAEEEEVQQGLLRERGGVQEVRREAERGDQAVQGEGQRRAQVPEGGERQIEGGDRAPQGGGGTGGPLLEEQGRGAEERAEREGQPADREDIENSIPREGDARLQAERQLGRQQRHCHTVLHIGGQRVLQRGRHRHCRNIRQRGGGYSVPG